MFILKKAQLAAIKVFPFLLGIIYCSFSNALHVKDFGALPDDSICDIIAIRAAINHAKEINAARLEFDAGVYNLDEDTFHAQGGTGDLITIIGVSGLILEGKSGTAGEPLTRFERNIQMRNNPDLGRVLSIRSSADIHLKNIIISNNPQFTSAGEVVLVDRANDIVVVDVFEGLPHFDGMWCASANVWDLTTRRLLPLNALTIGVDLSQFENNTWESISGGGGRRYRIKGLGFSDRINPGDGMSWHFSVRAMGGQMSVHESTDIVLENMRFTNSHIMVFTASFVKNLSLIKVRVEPDGKALAVGARDAFHLSCCSGTLLVDSCYIRGVRWDPFNIKARFAEVQEVIGRRKIAFTTFGGAQDGFGAKGEKVVFWKGAEPFEYTVKSASLIGRCSQTIFNRTSGVSWGIMEFKRRLPPEVSPGTFFTPLSWTFDRAYITNTTIESNFGRAILFQSRNLTVENCTFRNNAYANIALGAEMYLEGGFVQNVQIRNNRFIGSTWVVNWTPGTVSMFNRGEYNSPHHPDAEYFQKVPYNRNIVIENNLFQDINLGGSAAIHISNAGNVRIMNNRFENCQNQLIIDPGSTEYIFWEDSLINR